MTGGSVLGYRSAVPESLPTLSSFHCFACSPDHPKGLQLRFKETPQGVRSQFQVGPDHVGIDGVVHGGIAATIFDEAMAWALYRHKYAPYLTAHMEQRFRRPIRTDTPLVVEATITDDRSSRVRVASSLTEADEPGVELASANGLYVRAPDDVIAALPTDQQDDLEQIFSEFRRRDGAA